MHAIANQTPRFAGVTYMGSKEEPFNPKAVPYNITQASAALPIYSTRVHQFQVDGDDKAKFNWYRQDNDIIELRETQVYSAYPGDVRSGLDRVFEATVRFALDDRPNNYIVQRNMTMGVDEAELFEDLIDKAQEPDKSKIGGSPDPFMGPLNPKHKPYFHVDNPGFELWDLRGVKFALRDALSSNLFKQLKSITPHTQMKQQLSNITDLLKKAMKPKP